MIVRVTAAILAALVAVPAVVAAWRELPGWRARRRARRRGGYIVRSSGRFRWGGRS